MNFNKEYIDKLNRFEDNIKLDFNDFIKILNTHDITHDKDKYNIIFYRKNDVDPFCVFAKEILFRVSGMSVCKNNKDQIIDLTNKEFYKYYINLILYLKSK